MYTAKNLKKFLQKRNPNFFSSLKMYLSFQFKRGGGTYVSFSLLKVSAALKRDPYLTSLINFTFSVLFFKGRYFLPFFYFLSFLFFLQYIQKKNSFRYPYHTWDSRLKGVKETFFYDVLYFSYTSCKFLPII